MKLTRLLTTCLLYAVLPSARPQGRAPEHGRWHAIDPNSMAITGDVSFAAGKLTIGSTSFPLRRMRALTAAEIADPNASDPGHTGEGSLYSLSIPASRHFLHGKSLCANDVSYMTLFVSDQSLELAFFSGKAVPDLNSKAPMKNANFCGNFVYVR